MARVYTGENVEDFIFGEGTTYEESTVEEGAKTEETPEEDVEEGVEVTDAELHLDGVLECTDDPAVACYRIALENEQNYNSLMNAMMGREYSVLEQTGETMVYEAANIKGFFENLKKIVQKWWDKITGAIKKAIEGIQASVATNKAFVAKYRKAKMQTPEKSKEFKGYKFPANEAKYAQISDLVQKAVDVRTISNLSDEKATEVINDFKDSFDTTKAHMRGAACGNVSNTISSDDYERQLKLAYFGSTDKVAIDLVPFGTLISELSTADEAKKAVKAAYKEAESAVKGLHKDIKVAEVQLMKNAGIRNSGMKVGKCLSDAVNASLIIMSKALHVQISAMNTKVAQDRAMAAFYIKNQPDAAPAEPAAKTESVELTDDLDIVLI